jgi:RluA family pseudouridine synthase
MPTLTVKSSEQQLTVLEFLQRRIPAAPRAFLRQLLKKGRVLGETGPLAEQDQLPSGATLRLPDSGRVRELLVAAPPASAQVRILFESRETLVADKPAGLAVHAGVGHEQDNLTCRLKGLLAERGDRFTIAPIHRLDLETSGPVIFGKGKLACGELGRLFMRDEVEKQYLALVVGRTAGSGTLQSAVPAKGKQKEARTSFRALERTDTASLLELTLHSGRQHQIRRQLADLGHPLFGDRRYGGPCPDILPRTFLHCTHLAFVDPYSGATVVIDSPLPAELDKALTELGFRGILA